MVKIKYAMKKGDKYYTPNDGWSKDIYKADLFKEGDRALSAHEYPEFHKKAHPIPIRETYIREEV